MPLTLRNECSSSQMQVSASHLQSGRGAEAAPGPGQEELQPLLGDRSTRGQETTIPLAIFCPTKVPQGPWGLTQVNTELSHAGCTCSPGCCWLLPLPISLTGGSFFKQSVQRNSAKQHGKTCVTGLSNKQANLLRALASLWWSPQGNWYVSRTISF